MVRIFCILFFLFVNFPVFGDENIKKPNVSGQFYSADPAQLSADVESYLSQADVKPSQHHIELIIAPHAGYVYSGWVAGYSYKAVSNQKVSTVVILAPDHFYGFDGVSVWPQGGFETPFGVAPVDQEFTGQIFNKNPKIMFEPKAFAKEHSLEVEIPFIQKTFPDAKIVPIIVGQASGQTLNDFAAILQKAVGDRKDILIVASTDLSHYHDDQTARAMDNRTIEAVKSLNVEELWGGHQQKTMEMCGVFPVTAAMVFARLQGINKVDLLKYGNSGDTTGDKSSVVGYSALIFYRNEADEESAGGLNAKEKKELLRIARQTMEEYVLTGKTLEFKEEDPRLSKIEGAFVTIRKQGDLRGCIGNIIGQGPLFKTVRDMAIASSTQDHRFPPVKKDELKDLDVEISVLSVPVQIKNTDEIVLGKHGVIVKNGPFKSGVFLPQVATETGWGKEKFLSELCAQKAGLPVDCWKDPGTEMFVFTAQVFSEKDAD